MRAEKRQRLEAGGWKVGGAKEFLGLTDEEAAMVEIRLSLARALKESRLARNWTQAKLAKELGSSQSRVAKMEAGDASVSIDLLVRSLLVSGATGAEIGGAFTSVRRRKSPQKLR